jgi:CelD/BcsL family acetyltransferase involved in cellulose biosynthesis
MRSTRAVSESRSFGALVWGSSKAPTGPESRASSAQPLQVAVLGGAEAISALEAEWRELFDCAISPNPAQGFDFARALQETFHEPASSELMVATCRSASGLIGLWPLLAKRRSYFVSLESAGFGAGEEYSGPLIRAGADGHAVVNALLRALKTHGDVLKTIVPLDNAFRFAAPVGRSAYRQTVFSPTTRLTRWPDFEAWLGSKSSSFRKGLRYDRKKLQEQGVVRLIDGGGQDQTSSSLIDWLFEEKRAYLGRKGSESAWLVDDRSRELLRNLFRESSPSRSGVELWCLLVDDQPAAGAICFQSRTAIELFMFVMNPAFAARSPGNLLLEDIAKSASARGKDFDFRITSESYKARWADDDEHYEYLVIALNPRGVPSVVRRWLKRQRNRFRELTSPPGVVRPKTWTGH